MLCVTLTLANSVPSGSAGEIVDELVTSLNLHPDAIGGEVTRFKAVGSRQVQGCLMSAEKTVGFVLSAARSVTWGVHLVLIKGTDQNSLVSDERSLRPVLDQAAAAGPRSLRAPGGVAVEVVRAGRLVGATQAHEVGPIESTLQLLCAIERRRSDEGQEAGLMVNAGKSQTKAAELLGVSQQAVSSRLQAGYWYESRKVAYWLAVQIDQLLAP